MIVFELPIHAMDFFTMVRDGGPYADVLVDVKEVIQHSDDNCDRILNFYARAPLTTAFMVEIQKHSIIIKMCRCNREQSIKADWSYNLA